MGQHKFEKQLREKINQREIAPSPQAWDRLDAMLTVAEQQKPKRNINWLFIAASLIGLLLVGTIFFSNIEKVSDQPRKEVVIENHTDLPSVKKEPTVITTDVPSAVVAEVEASQATLKSTIKTSYNQQSTIKTSEQRRLISNQSLAATAQSLQQPDNLEKGESINPDLGSSALHNQKTNLPSTRAKVDELLAQVAQADAQPKTSVKVSAKNLLSTVDEAGSALSFREKMMRRANDVAVAVSTRNIEQ